MVKIHLIFVTFTFLWYQEDRHKKNEIQKDEGTLVLLYCHKVSPFSHASPTLIAFM